MSRISDLMRQLGAREPELARDLEREIAALADRRAFGLNFERHVPEAVELPGRRIRTGDKVRILPPRGQTPNKSNDALWLVAGFDVDGGSRKARLHGVKASLGEGAEHELAGATASVDDLVVVAEFRDPIYPGLVSTGKVERGGNKPYHAVINAENYHALQTMLFTHRGGVDCIYIDPPYNSGARDWKYNNDYVEGDDLYRHSKWLAFIERRLSIAKELLNPAGSVLIVTIDEREVHRLGLLLAQTFPEARIQMVTALINPKGVARGQDFYRVDEYIFFLWLGETSLHKSADAMISTGKASADDIVQTTRKVRWGNLLRSGTDARRADRPNQFYPIYLSQIDGTLHSIGAPLLPATKSRAAVEPPGGTVAVWPIRSDGSEGRWQVGWAALSTLFELGYASVGRFAGHDRVSFSYVTENVQAEIVSGAILITGRNARGVVSLSYADDAAITSNPKTMWNKASHSASEYGSSLLRAMLPGRTFPFPKSLYAVEDTLRFVVGANPRAVVVDFFAGSGTTAHAVMRLNRQDGGERLAICITNNEVAADDQKDLRTKGLRPGDVEWENLGICEHITKPRIEAAVTGRTPDGKALAGDYKFTDEGRMADGLGENVEFFTLTYEAPLRVASNREFSRIAPLLWLRAGSKGRRIDSVSAGWDVAETYGVLVDLDHTEDFLKKVAANDDAKIVFIVTDEDRLFEAVVQELPDHIECVRLYEAYLRNFEIESGRGAL